MRPAWINITPKYIIGERDYGKFHSFGGESEQISDSIENMYIIFRDPVNQSLPEIKSVVRASYRAALIKKRKP